MVKKPGVSLLKNLKHKGKKTTTPKRLKVSKVKKEEGEILSTFDDFSPEEGLEDTPVASAMPETQASTIQNEALQSKEDEPAETLAEEKRAPAKVNKPRAKSGTLRSVSAWVAGLFSSPNMKSKGHAAALEFAGNRKRLGRKGRRNRRILVYAGSGFAVVVVMLLVFLVPGGSAAPTNTAMANAGLSESAGGSAGTASTDTAAAALTPTPTASPTPVPTTKPEPSDQPIDMDELLKFYVVEADKYYTYSNNHYEYTQEELKMLAQVIYKEARGQTRDGKVAVGNVIMNRVLCPGRFGKTIKEVVTAPGQFAYDPSAPTTGCIAAARWVLDYELWVVPQDVYYFRATSKFSSLKGQDWGSHKYYAEISGHYFYRHAYGGRTRGGDIPPQLFERTYKYAQFGCKVEDRVVRIQFMLDALGYNIEKTDGYFGMGTKKALVKFQQDHGLDDDGVAGPATVQRLIEEYGVRDYFAKYGP